MVVIFVWGLLRLCRPAASKPSEPDITEESQEVYESDEQADQEPGREAEPSSQEDEGR